MTLDQSVERACGLVVSAGCGMGLAKLEQRVRGVLAAGPCVEQGSECCDAVLGLALAELGQRELHGGGVCGLDLAFGCFKVVREAALGIAPLFGRECDVGECEQRGQELGLGARAAGHGAKVLDGVVVLSDRVQAHAQAIARLFGERGVVGFDEVYECGCGIVVLALAIRGLTHQEFRVRRERVVGVSRLEALGKAAGPLGVAGLERERGLGVEGVGREAVFAVG